MTLARALQVAAGNSQETGDVAEAIDFDGTNDYLSRSTDLTGNTLRKTFTFSAFVWVASTSTNETTIYSAYDASGSTTTFYVSVLNYQVRVYATNTAYSLILQASADLYPTSKAYTYYHILISMDLSNEAKRSIYINDITQSLSVSAYVNQNIYFATSRHYIEAIAGTPKAAARISHVYLDSTYRDLSIEANRRLFVTADLKPAAGQAALNPILYLPMNDPTAPGVNAGTGGNFTLTGTVARSGRGPNQYNAPYSDLDGTADYLSRTTALTGIADGKAFTLSFCFNKDSASSKYPFTIYSNTTKRFRAIVDSGGYITIEAQNSSGTDVLFVSSSGGSIALNRNYVITVSVDLTDTAKRHLYINGSAATATWYTYTNTEIDFNPATPRYYAGYDANPATFWDGDLGAVWFNTNYIDLSVAANRAKFVTGTGIDAKPVDLGASGELPTGTSPLIYLPMYGNNAGKNYGTGGDFTVNSGPYTGARGPNEFWGNLATFNGTNSYLSKSGAISGLSNSKTFSLSLFFNKTLGTTTDYLISWPTTGGNHTLFFNTATSMNQSWRNTLGNAALGGWTPTIPDATNVHLLICVDMDDVNKCKIYINGTVHAGTPGTFVTGTTLDFASINNPIVGVYDSASLSSVFNGKLSEFYFTNQYIDFTQEANRLKFRDAFGNPVNLTQQIEDGAIPNPAIYMRFPPTSFGTNSGTGGNFTVNGTITDGGQL